MLSKKEFYRSLPEVVKGILLVSEGWLVGSSIENHLEEKENIDYDILIQDRQKYQLTIMSLNQLPVIMTVNSYGGLKFEVFKISIDIWPEELDHFLKSSAKINYIYNHKAQILLNTK